MKKPVTKSKTRVTSRVRRPAVAKLAKTTVAKKTRRTVASKAVSKKVSQPKGLKHHAKRIYHLTPKFVHGIVAGAFVGIIVVASLGITGGVYANPKADECIQTQGGINVNEKHANSFVRLKGACGKKTLVMKSYYAPSASGEPHDEQVKYQDGAPTVVKSGGSNEWIKLNVDMPDPGCFYQVDLVDITDGNDGSKNPIVAAVTGGNRDCTPDNVEHNFACAALQLTLGDNRTATITTFTVTKSPAVSLTGVTIDWNDGPVVNAPTALNQSHGYPADGTYTVKVTAHFAWTGQFGKARTGDASCQQPITFTTPPTPEAKMINVCEISTQRILSIDEKLLGTAQYPSDLYTTDLTKCVVTPVVTTNTPPTQLANTGPGAVLIIFGLAILGGYAFHMRHRHVQHKKRHHTVRHAH